MAASLQTVHFENLYTTYTFSSLIVILILALIFWRDKLFRFIPTYILMLVPFFIVNGVLTGSWINDQVVWYNDAENLGVRAGTIPIEDFFYGFEMLFLTVLFMRD